MEFTYPKKELADHRMSMKKLVIVKPGCKEFGNELLNHISIYAYGLDIEAEVVNHSVYGYPSPLRAVHALYARFISYKHRECSLSAWRAPIFLPPTKPLSRVGACNNTLYFFGWVFRNQLGLTRHRENILKAFAPTGLLLEKIDHILSPWKGRRLVGVHLRQESFKGFPKSEFLVPVTRVRKIVDEYLKEKGLHAKDVTLIIVSDADIPKETFADFAVHLSLGNTPTNLFLLSRCSVVLGTNTTFSNVAAWFGNVPHIVTTNEAIDWTYYRAQHMYFENKYATFAF
mgnify:CR=1 FL=1